MFETISEKFRDELNPGERIIWSGQPQQGLLLRARDIFQFPFLLIWCGITSYWEYTMITNGAPFPLLIFGALFVVPGLYMIIDIYLGEMVRRSQTYYALTNERVIILFGVFTQNIISLPIDKIKEINFSAKHNGKGTITFGRLMPVFQSYESASISHRYRYLMPPSFEMIEDAKRVYQQIKQLQREGA